MKLKPKPKSGTLSARLDSDVPILSVEGYFNDETGKMLQEEVRKVLFHGKKSIVLDLKNCHTINSLGVAMILMVTLEAADDFGATLYLTGLNDLKISVLTLAGVTARTVILPEVQDALKQIKGKS